MAITGLLPEASLKVRAITLIDDVGAVSAPLVLSDRFDRELFFDMKTYVNRELQPRAFMASGSAVRDDTSALKEIGRQGLQGRRSGAAVPITDCEGDCRGRGW